MNKGHLQLVRKEWDKRKGQRRDEATVDSIKLVGCLVREQIQELHFEKAIKKCQHRLNVLYSQKKLLQRGRCDVSDSYCYWPTGQKKPYRIDHNILLNWIYISARAHGVEVKTWIAPYIQPEVEPDAFTIFCYDGKFIPLFIEFQRAINNSTFDKVAKYINHFLALEWAKKDWAKPCNNKKVYPTILVVTDGRKEHIQELIEQQNKFEYEGNEASLNFKVATLEEVRLDIRKVIE